MDYIISFYNNIFAIQIMVFGIIAAVYFVFIQIVYSKYSFREVSFLFSQIKIVAYIIMCVASLSLNALGCYTLTYFHKTQSPMMLFFQNAITAGILLLLFIALVIIFVYFCASNLEYIQPKKIMLLIGKKIECKQIGLFLLKKYGLPFRYENVIHADIFKGFSNKSANVEKTKAEIKIETSCDEDTYLDKLKKEIEPSEDPFDPLHTLISQSIKIGDIATLKSSLSVINIKSQEFINSNQCEKDNLHYSPFKNMRDNYAQYIVESFIYHIELCDSHAFQSGKRAIIQECENLFNLLIKDDEGQGIIVILEFLKTQADISIDHPGQTFVVIIESFSSFGKFILKDGLDEKNENFLVEIFRRLGWIGERLIQKTEFEDKPFMYDATYDNKFEHLIDTLFSLGYIYREKYPEEYPLIYFDAILVIFMQLAKSHNANHVDDYVKHISLCFQEIYDFGKEMVIKGNSRGAALAANRFSVALNYLKTNKYDLPELEIIIIEKLIQIGGVAAGFRNRIDPVDFMNEGIEEFVISKLQNSPYRNEIIVEMGELQISGKGNREWIKEFVDNYEQIM